MIMKNNFKTITIFFAIAIILLFSSCSVFKSDDNILTFYTPTPTPDLNATATPVVQNTQDTSPYFRAPAIDVPTNSLNALLEEYIPATSKQAILVTIYNGTQKLYCVEAKELGWRVVYGPFECNTGRGGIDKQKEGDGKSPIGVYELGSAFGFGGAPEGTTWPWRETVETDYWIEDSDSQYYNQYINLDQVEKDWRFAAKLKIPEYRRAIEVKYNDKNTPNLGSAIFLHIWTSETTSTGGCTSMADTTIDTVISWLQEDENPVLLQAKYVDPLPDGFCYIKDFAPEIKFDIRFAGEDNIFGRKANEYYQAVGISSIDMANALNKASLILKGQNLTLKVYDSYRPQTTVNAIVDWLVDDIDIAMKERYYPNTEKSEMLDMFFESKSAYSRGGAVDLTIIDENNNELDMGTVYQYIDEKSDYNYRNLTDEQRSNRKILRDAMLQVGLLPNDTFWWSFYLEDEPFANMYYDFYIE